MQITVYNVYNYSFNVTFLSKGKCMNKISLGNNKVHYWAHGLIDLIKVNAILYGSNTFVPLAVQGAGARRRGGGGVWPSW